MYKFIKRSIVTGTLILLLVSMVSANAKDQVADEYRHAGKVYPPVFFVSNIDDETVLQKLKDYNAFTKLDKDAVGLPIGVRILKGRRNKQDAASFSSTMLSASTLGLIPVVANTEFKVHYDVFVQGKSIATFKYQMDATEVANLWTVGRNTGETKPSEVLFIEHTIPKFLNEMKHSSEVQAVFQEYWEYFN